MNPTHLYHSAPNPKANAFLRQTSLSRERRWQPRGLLFIAACAWVATGLVLTAPAAPVPGASSRAGTTTSAIFGRVQSEVTGQYLLNVRVTVEGTALEAFTDAYGTFRLAQVPSGRVTLGVASTGSG